MTVALNLICNKQLLYPISEVSGQLGFELTEKGIPVTIDHTGTGFRASFKNGQGNITYEKKVELFRALSMLVPAVKRKQEWEITQTSLFNSNGAMFDCSRNAVLTVESAKKIIRYMALMGLDTFMLYTEDTYKVEGLDYFGYMRGAYTREELIEIDRYGQAFGIEVVPCIQTLAHLIQALKWQELEPLKDTKDTLMVGSEDTYDFIEKLISHCASTFTTKRIHLGMDEAMNLGLGEYLKKYGYTTHKKLMNMHMKRVMSIAEKYNMKPMIWSDMLTNNARSGEESLDFEVDRNIGLVYWSYRAYSMETHLANIQENKKLSDNVIFAGGIWGWSNVAVNYIMTLDASETALMACKQEGVKDVFVTWWGDTGAEVNMFYSLLGLQFYAEHGYNKQVDRNVLCQRFLECTGYSYDAFYRISRFSVLDDSKESTRTAFSNAARCILYQDILKGLFDVNLQKLNMDLTQYYNDLEQEISKHEGILFQFLEKLAYVLKQKWNLGIRIGEAYKGNDIAGLRSILPQLSQLTEAVKELRLIHRQQWFETYKPFGWEVLDSRYGTILSNIDTTEFRLSEYISGNERNLPELDCERLMFKDWWSNEGEEILLCHFFGRTISAGVFDMEG